MAGDEMGSDGNGGQSEMGVSGNGGQEMGVSVQILTEFHPESRCDPKG